MKKLCLNLLILCLLVFAVACGNVTNVQELNEDNTTNELNAEQEELKALLDKFKDTVEFGTAGSSLKAVPHTLKLIEWGNNTTLTENEIAKVVTENDFQSSMEEIMMLLDGTYQTLISENREGLLEDSGFSDSVYTLPNEKINAIENLMKAFSLR